MPLVDLGTRRHRCLDFHARQCSPLRGHSYVRLGEHFAGTFRKSRRGIDFCFVNRIILAIAMTTAV